jgi:hypothetical protein
MIGFEKMLDMTRVPYHIVWYGNRPSIILKLKEYRNINEKQHFIYFIYMKVRGVFDANLSNRAKFTVT